MPALTTLPGTVFDEDHLRFDRSLVFDALREAGFASPTVIPHAAVDPELHQAWVEFSAVPGPASRFGDIRILTIFLLGRNTDPVLNQMVEQESQIFHDIVVENFSPGAMARLIA